MKKTILDTIDITCFGAPLSYDQKLRGVATKTLLRLGVTCDNGQRTERCGADNVGHWGVDASYVVEKSLVGEHANNPLVAAIAGVGMKMHPDATAGTTQDVEAFLVVFGTMEDIARYTK